MIFTQLSLNFLNQFISKEQFQNFRESLEIIKQDGHFDFNIKDKELAVLIFENSISDDFFCYKKSLVSFCQALPEITQNKIISSLNLDKIQSIEWSNETFDFLHSTFGLNVRFKFTPKYEDATKFDGITIIEKPERIFKNLKEYQYSIFFEVYNYISYTPYSRCIVQMPTGSGKTRTAIEVASEVLNNTKRNVLWLANTQELCDQAYETFLDIWHFNKRLNCQAINHLYAETISHRSDFTEFHVSTLQSLNNDKALTDFLESKLDLNQLELVIVDEAHISIAPTYKKLIEKLLIKGAKLIGLTATPGRQLKAEEQQDQNKTLSDFYFNKLFSLNIPSGDTIDYLRDIGVLATTKFHSIEGSTLEKFLSEKEIEDCKTNFTLPKKLEKILTNEPIRNAVIFDKLVELLNRGKKIIFFATSIEHSKLISTMLKMKGFSSAHIDGNTGQIRKSLIDKFKSNEIQILCNYGVLSTGFDEPKIDVVFMARPTNSIVLYSQIIGRGLRGPLIGGTEFCEIYSIIDNILDLPDNNTIFGYFDEYFNN
jgi:superfamily II DNA or RNA helicase